MPRILVKHRATGSIWRLLLCSILLLPSLQASRVHLAASRQSNMSNNEPDKRPVAAPRRTTRSRMDSSQVHEQRVDLRGSERAYFYSSLVAGVLSGALSSCLCAPLDLVRVRMQVWGQVSANHSTIAIRQLLGEIRAKEGYRGFFRGLGATLLTVPMFWGVYFPLYDDFKRRWAEHQPMTNPAWIHMGSAVAAGAISDVICNPMFVVRTRLQTEALHAMTGGSIVPKSIRQTAMALYQEGGVPIFWRGMSANLLGLSHVAVQFPCYELLKKTLRQQKRHESAIDLVLASSLSKMVASLLSYPHEVIRSRMMDARSAHPGLIPTCRAVYRNEGWLGFYAGLPVSLLRVLPNTCVTFLAYELILRKVRSRLEARAVSSRVSWH